MAGYRICFYAKLTLLFAAFSMTFIDCATVGGQKSLKAEDMKDLHLMNVTREAIRMGVNGLEKISTAVGVESTNPRLDVVGDIEIMSGTVQVVAGMRYRLTVSADIQGPCSAIKCGRALWNVDFVDKPWEKEESERIHVMSIDAASVSSPESIMSPSSSTTTSELSPSRNSEPQLKIVKRGGDEPGNTVSPSRSVSYTSLTFGVVVCAVAAHYVYRNFRESRPYVAL